MIRRLHRSWRARVAVVGNSMLPTLQPGDWLLADPEAYQDTVPAESDLVLAPDPREPTRLLVKRVAGIDPDDWLRLAGDTPEASTDSRTFGAVDPAEIVARPWFRYWPLRRIGRVS